MRLRRLLLASLVITGLAPGTFVRSELPPRDYSSPVSITALKTERLKSGPLTLEGAWHFTSGNDHFGGYSSLIEHRPGKFLAASDAGKLISFSRPDIGKGPIVIDPFLSSRLLDKRAVDIESLAVDSATGAVWAGLEWEQAIISLGPDLIRRESVQPVEMQQWGDNTGPEAMVRLGDGRFIVIEERSMGGGRHQALLFPGDPVDGASPVEFVFQAREEFRPSDAALLPDGRIAVLLRSFEWGLPPRFPVQIVIADPSEIVPGEVLPSIFLAAIETPLPSDNFEGLSVIDAGQGRWDFWLISDDNFASYQRTLLLKLRWDRGTEQQKARR